jgi:hypothetical protein
MGAMLLDLLYTDMGTLMFPIKGGAPEDGGDTGEDSGEEGEEETEEEVEEEDDYTPPSKDEFTRMQAALKKANREAAQRRHLLDQNGIDARTGKRYDEEEDDADEDIKTPPLKTKRKTTDGDEEETSGIDPAELAKLQKQARIDSKRAAQREARLMTALGKSAAKSALAEAGWNGKGANVIERMIDLSEIEIGDDGEIIGLDDQIAEVKGDMPEWFKQARVKRVRPASSGADVNAADKGNGAPPAESKGWLQRLEDQFQGIEE